MSQCHFYTSQFMVSLIDQEDRYWVGPVSPVGSRAWQLLVPVWLRRWLSLHPTAFNQRETWGFTVGTSIAESTTVGRWLRNLRVWCYGFWKGPNTVLIVHLTGVDWAEDETAWGNIRTWESIGIPVAVVYRHRWRRQLLLRWQGWMT